MALKSFCELLPKIELHAHLNGSISFETLQKLRNYNSEITAGSETDLESWSNFEKIFNQSNISSLSECFSIFKVAHSVTTSPETIKMATKSVIEDFAEDNVIYLELRSTLRQEANMSKIEYIESMIEAVKNCKCSCPDITVKLIVSINRKDSLKEAEENVDIAIKYSKIEPDIIVGVDLSGDPNQKTFTDYIDILNKARKEGLKLTIHFAEVPGNSEINEILNYQPNRLGHGTCVHPNCEGNSENWDFLLNSKIPVEVCITSNLKCKTVTSVEKHHFQYLYNSNHPIALCTDDKSVFQTNLSKEYEIVKNTFQFSPEDLWMLNYRAVEHVFADEKVKASLKEKLTLWKEYKIKNETFKFQVI